MRWENTCLPGGYLYTFNLPYLPGTFERMIHYRISSGGWDKTAALYAPGLLLQYHAAPFYYLYHHAASYRQCGAQLPGMCFPTTICTVVHNSLLHLSAECQSVPHHSATSLCGRKIRRKWYVFTMCRDYLCSTCHLPFCYYLPAFCNNSNMPFAIACLVTQWLHAHPHACLPSF